MKKLTYFLFLLLLVNISSSNSVFALTCDAPEYEEQFGYNIKKSIAPSPKDRSNADKAVYGELLAHRAFESAGYTVCPSKHLAGDHGSDGLYFKKQKSGGYIVVVNESKYVSNGSFRLGKSNCVKCKGGAEKCQQMSWKWVQYALRYIESKEDGCTKMIKWALKEPETRIVRTYTNIGDDGRLRFFALYGTDEEKKHTMQILRHVKGKASDLPEFGKIIEYAD